MRRYFIAVQFSGGGKQEPTISEVDEQMHAAGCSKTFSVKDEESKSRASARLPNGLYCLWSNLSCKAEARRIEESLKELSREYSLIVFDPASSYAVGFDLLPLDSYAEPPERRQV